MSLGIVLQIEVAPFEILREGKRLLGDFVEGLDFDWLVVL